MAINQNVRTTPLARKMAAEKGIDLSQVKATGPYGRILVKDLESYQPSINGGSSNPQISSSGSGPSTHAWSDAEIIEQLKTINAHASPLSFEDKPMSGVRKATVKGMTLSHQINAAFTGTRQIDVTDLVSLRKQLIDAAKSQNIKLTYLAFIVKATAKTLKDLPNVNVRINEENSSIRFLKNINIGIAVDTPEGLFVPVIKNADQLSVFQIAHAIEILAAGAKDKKLSLKDMSEATFTITNFGSVGLEYGTPVINPPEAAILGVGAMHRLPVYLQPDDIWPTPRFMMPFSMTADHRVVDGADAGRFLLKLESYLMNPALLLL